MAKFSPISSGNLTARHNRYKLAGPAPGSKIFFMGGTKRPVLARQPPLTIAPKQRSRQRLAFMPQASLFHKARGRERAGNDRTDVDPATPRFTGRLGTAVECR